MTSARFMHHRSSARDDSGSWLLATSLGAGIMYFLDPQNGRRRRARVRDRLTHLRRVAREASGVTARDVAARSTGMLAVVSRKLGTQPRDDSDTALTDRIRSRLGRVVSHPHAVHVSVQNGRVTVSGPILAPEAPRLLDAIRAVPGVREIDDQLQVHEEAGNISALQGGVPRAGHRFELLQDNWSPTARLLTGSTGLALIGNAARSQGLLSAALALIGSGLVLRAATNRQLASLAGMGAHCRDIEVQKSIHIRAPIAQVFQFWTEVRNFPSFMTRVREVQQIDDSRSYWRVAGPAGVPVEWTAEITRVVPEQLIEWRSDDGARIRHQGRVRFEKDGENATRVHVQLRYFPPAGAVGHVVATLFGADPKSGLDADLMRMKSVLETGNAPHDAARAPESRTLPGTAPS